APGTPSASLLTSAAGLADKPANARSKKIGNQNALSHGVYSKNVVLPWESQDDYEMLYKDFYEEWEPKGRTQVEAVLDLTNYTWMKHRMMKGSQLPFFRSTISAELKSKETSWDDIVRHQAMIPKQAHGAILNVNKFMSNLDVVFEMIRSRPYAQDNADGKVVQQQLKQLQYDVMTLIEKTKTDVITKVEILEEIVQESANRFEQAYRAEEFDKQLDLAAKIDARIEKTLRRLTSLKVFQRVEREASLHTSQSALESPPTVPEESSQAP
ncbi:MAG TPA: hypothetical protein VIY48_03095, partial [Candidatus Paceibacterota bacterium]